MAEDPSKVKLTGVRLSFPALFKPASFEGQEESKFGGTFILDKKQDRDQVKKLSAAIKQIANDHFKGKIPGSLKLCLRDGKEKDDLDGYGPGVVFISSSCKKRPLVVDKDLSNLEEKDDKPYAGCYVNATLRLWVQDNKWGKRVNAQLRAVQFVKDGDPFGEGAVNAEEEFEALEDESDDEVEVDGFDDLLGDDDDDLLG